MHRDATLARGLLVLTLLLGLVPTLVLLGPAGAAYAAEATGELCAEGEGVSVVVDPGELGGEVRRECVVTDGTELASEAFEAAGVEVTPVGSFPGAACRVDGEPADAACRQMPPADAYWGLFLAQPDGTWDYAPTGADELELEAGDYVGFAWQTGAQASPPGVEPVPGEGAAASEEPAQEQPAQEQPAEEQPAEDGGLPGWVLAVVGLGLLAALAVVVVRRRRSGS